MRQHTILFGLLASAAVLLGAIPAVGQMDDLPVTQYERLVAAARLHLADDGRASLGDLVGKVITVDANDEVLAERPYQTRSSEFSAAAADLPSFPCVYDSDRPGFTAYTPTSCQLTRGTRRVSSGSSSTTLTAPGGIRPRARRSNS